LRLMRPHSHRRWSLLAAVGVSVLTAALAACTDVPDPSADTIVIVETEVPTTMLNVGYLDVLGFSYCEVVGEVVGDLRVYIDPASDFGDPSSTRDAYVGALRAFDALAQVAPPEIKDEAELLRATLDDSVQAALDAGWDITAIRESAGGRVDPEKVAAALAELRTFTKEQCAVDLAAVEEGTPAAPDETPGQRIKRILGDLFPDLDDAKLACLEPRLPLDFDPTSEYFDPSTISRAFRSCRIDLNDPGAPTSVAPAPFTGPRPTTPTGTTIVTGTSSEVDPPGPGDESSEA